MTDTRKAQDTENESSSFLKMQQKRFTKVNETNYRNNLKSNHTETTEELDKRSDYANNKDYFCGKLGCSNFTLVDILQYRAQQQPDQKAFIFLQNGEAPSSSLTYKELDQQARAIAAQFQALGAKGERVILLYPPGLEFIAAFFGCLYADVIAVPVSRPRPNRSMSRHQAIVADAQATMVLATASLMTKMGNWLAQDPAFAGLQWLVTDNIANESASLWQKPQINSDTLAFLQYTSGSTGTPKGVMVSHSNLLYNSESIRQSFGFTSESLSVTWLPSFHDMGLVGGIIQPLYTGFTAILMSPESFFERPIRWLQAISQHRATHCGGPNFAYDLCVNKVTLEQKKILDLSSWCNAYNGAEPIRKETLERFVAAFTACGFRARFLYPCYGLAESTLMVSSGLIKDEPIYCTVEADLLEQNQVAEVSENNLNVRHLVGCGRSWLDAKIIIADPKSLMRCSSNQVGEIWVSSSSVARGYWNHFEETEKTFQAYLADTGEGPFLRTGDLGFLKDGELFITGRIKDVIIIRGRNYYPQDIEMTVEKSNPALRPNCGAAFAVEVDGVEHLVIVQEVERSYLKNLNVEEVLGDIRQALATQYELSVYAVVLIKPVTIPKTSSGKIKRHACKAQFLSKSLDVLGGKIGNSEFSR